MSTTTEERFWSKVNKDGPTQPHMDTPCWVWTSSANYGYGIFSAARIQGAHRVSWWLAHGENPGSLYVCHKCDNPPCVRPDHLFLGTAADNNRDRMQKEPARRAREEAARNAPEAIEARRVAAERAAEFDRVEREKMKREVHEWWATQPRLFAPGPVKF